MRLVSKLPAVALGVFTLAALLAVLDFYGLAAVSGGILMASRWLAVAALCAFAAQRRSLTTWILVAIVAGSPSATTSLRRRSACGC